MSLAVIAALTLLSPVREIDWTTRAIARGSVERREVALSIDDGPNPSTTPYLLDVLQKHHAHATFFLIGRRVKRYPEFVKQIIAEGHEVGNHTMTHTDLRKLNAEGVKKEWSDCSDAIKEILGFPPSLCRPPGGQANKDVIQSAGRLGMKAVYWTLNSKDFDANDVETVRKAVMKGIQNGAIILLHDKVFHTFQALDKLLPWMEEEGYEFVSVGDMAAMDDNSNDRSLLPKEWLKPKGK